MKLLIVDDVEIDREILREFLKEEYEVLSAGCGAEALRILEETNGEIRLVLLDLTMPQMDGYQVLDAIRKNGWLERMPVIVISGETISRSEHRSLEMGAVDFIRKPFDCYVVKQRIQNTLELYGYRHSLERQVRYQHRLLREKNKKLQKQAERIAANNGRIIDVLGTVVEYRNLESGMHIRRVKEFTRVLAHAAMEMFPEYLLTEEEVERIAEASPLHDIGKICISDQILLKPGRLTAEEFEVMKTHTTKGAVLLENIRGAWDHEYGGVCYDICRSHHERWDGKGYPDGLAGEEIPLSAQLVAIADVYDALISKRCYKDAYPLEEAMRMIVSGQCGEFSEKLLRCFCHEREKMEEVAKKYV